MEIWFALIIPVVAVIILYVFFHKKIAWWESIMILVIISIVIMLMKYGTEVSQTSDKEYLMDYIIEPQKYEPWDEEVSCRHPKYCQEYNSCKSRNSKGECEGGYETVQCGYEHLYDVDYHPLHYTAITYLGKSIGISEETYLRLVHQFKATPIFVDLHRDYHSIDGDEYYVRWNGDVNTVEYLTYEHTYENRIQATHTILNFPEVDTSDIRYYNIKEYPDVKSYESHSLLGENNYEVNKYINQSNSLFASTKQVKIFYLIFKNQPLEAALKQEQYWKGGNKNEVNICIGIDNNRKIKWSYVFSWTKKEIVKIQIRDSIMSSKVLSNQTYKSIIDYSNNVIIQKFERRHFKEFSYLTVEPTKGCVIWTFVLSFILTGGLAVWVVNNGIDADGINTNGYKYDSYNRYRKY